MAQTTRELMLGFAEPQSVYFTSSLRLRGLFLLLVWPSVHWYSQHGDRINTADHSRARVVFSDRGGFHSSPTVFLTSPQRDEFVLGGLLCQPIQLRPFMWSKATVGSGRWMIQQAWHSATLPSEPKTTGRNPSAMLQCEYHKILLNIICMALPQAQGVFIYFSVVFLQIICILKGPLGHVLAIILRNNNITFIKWDVEKWKCFNIIKKSAQKHKQTLRLAKLVLKRKDERQNDYLPGRLPLNYFCSYMFKLTLKGDCSLHAVA